MTNFILRRFVALLVVTIRLSLCARQHLTLLDCCAPFQNLLKHMKPQSLVWRSFIFRILLRQTSVFKTFVAMATWRTCWPSMTHDWITPMRSSKRNKSSFNIRKKWLKGQFRVFLGLYNQLIAETRSAAKNHWMDWVGIRQCAWTKFTKNYPTFHLITSLMRLNCSVLGSVLTNICPSIVTDLLKPRLSVYRLMANHETTLNVLL